jgi:antitoxin MazE
MKTRIQKWGNSLALRIPRSFAEEACLGQETIVELSLDDGRLVVTPIPKPRVTLDELLASVTEENRHGEFETGPPVGGEVW